MAKKRNRKRHYQKRKQERERRAKTCAENYYKKQATTINKLKYVLEMAIRANNRAAQAERDSRNAEHSEKGSTNNE